MSTPTPESLGRRLAELRQASDVILARKQQIAVAVASGDARARAEFFGHSEALRQIDVEVEAIHMARKRV